MTYLIAAVALTVAGLLYARYLINKPEPAGAHHKPRTASHPFVALDWDRRCGHLDYPQADRCFLPRRCHDGCPPLWQRIRDRRLAERVTDDETVDTAYESLSAEQAHARGWDSYDDGPLMPLPPEVRVALDDPEPDGPICEGCGQPWDDCGCDVPDWAEDYPADPRADVANAEIDQYWRGYGDGARAEAEDPAEVATPEAEADAYVGDLGPAELPAPEPAPLTDYREETGSWAIVRDGVMAEAGGER